MRLWDVATKLRVQPYRLPDEGGLHVGGILTDVLAASGRHMPEGLVREDIIEALLDGLKGKARANLDRLRDVLHDGLDRQTRELLDMQQSSGRMCRGRSWNMRRAYWRLPSAPTRLSGGSADASRLRAARGGGHAGRDRTGN